MRSSVQFGGGMGQLVRSAEHSNLVSHSSRGVRFGLLARLARAGYQAGREGDIQTALAGQRKLSGAG